MQVFAIPLTARPQTFSITLRSVQYTCRLYWLQPMECWVLNIGDRIGNPIINGIPLVPGLDLLAQYRYTGIEGTMFVWTDDAIPDTVPNFTHLGLTGHLYYI